MGRAAFREWSETMLLDRWVSQALPILQSRFGGMGETSFLGANLFAVVFAGNAFRSLLYRFNLLSQGGGQCPKAVHQQPVVMGCIADAGSNELGHRRPAHGESFSR
ncbi:hypothetical protein D9M68_480080 [compost metagenome]